MGTLYVVATPIGNLEDISARALRILREVSVIAAEDTRHTGHLLRHFDISTRLISNHAFNERARQPELLALLQSGDVALVTDAGTPAISDPGAVIVDAALLAGHRVVAIPGPSALTAALSVSGLVDGPVTFLGFLPRKGRERDVLLRQAADSGFAFALFEAGNRVDDTLEAIAEIDPGRRVAVIRELTKIYEETTRGTASELAEKYRTGTPRGEVVIVVEHGQVRASEALDADAEVARLIDAGMRPSDAAKAVASQTGLSRSDLYRRTLDRKASRTGSPASGDA